jgi:hypothetical protein
MVVGLMRGIVFIGLVLCAQLTAADDFLATVEEFKTNFIRRYTFSSKSKLLSCCGKVEKELQNCLAQSSTSITLSDLIKEKEKEEEESKSEKECIAVAMMTSSRLSDSYSLYSEASTALWAAVSTTTVTQCVEFLVAEIDDGDADFGTAYTDASKVKKSRVPHWLKVPFVATLVTVFPVVLYVDADATVSFLVVCMCVCLFADI